MKTRLLKQLRKKYRIEERNGKYKAETVRSGTPYDFQKCLSWGSNLALCRRYITWCILSEARSRFSIPKRKMK